MPSCPTYKEGDEMGIKLVNAIITITVAVICIAAMLVPVVGDVQKTAGDQVTLTNDSSLMLKEVESGDVLKLVRTVTSVATPTYSDVWYLNDEPITGVSGSAWNVGIVSDGIYMQILGRTNSSAAWWLPMGSTNMIANYWTASSVTEDNGSVTSTVTFGDDSLTVLSGNTNSSASYDYTWAYVVCPQADGEYCCAISGGTGIVESASDVILCGAYTSGELDTMYYYKDGTSYVSNTDYTMTPSITTSLHSGTTDIYDATVSVSMTDGTDTESFTPYRIIVPYEVTGHATSGGYYSLLGAIPVMVIVGLLVTTIGMMVIRRND